MFIGWKLHLCMERNQLDDANNIITEYGLGLDKKKTHANEAAYASYGRLLIAQYKFDKAELLISELLKVTTFF